MKRNTDYYTMGVDGGWVKYNRGSGGDGCREAEGSQGKERSDALGVATLRKIQLLVYGVVAVEFGGKIVNPF